MYGGIDPRMMKQAMKKMGMSQTELSATRVIIELEDKKLVFENPSVSKVSMMGEESYQIAGEPTEEPLETDDSTPAITEEDIETVISQTGASHDDALAALEESKGDLAQAILNLKKQ